MDVNAALQSQVRNIETTYGKPVAHWFAVIEQSELTKHAEVVAMLKSEHGLAHGAAHRLSLMSRDRGTPTSPAAGITDPVEALYTGKRADLRPLHDAVMGELNRLGDVELAPKKGYLSLRRRKQFAMLRPTTRGRLDLGLILPADTACTDRLQSAATLNALFSHRVVLTSQRDIDPELRRWLALAYANAE